MLRLIELFVIDAIGELRPENAKSLELMTPKLREIYGTSGDWRQAISKALGFPDTMADSIRDLWQRNQQIARQNRASLSAEDFAVMFVDSNIPH